MTTEDRLYGVNASMAIKVPCRVATTAAITLEGEQTIDGVAVVTNDRVLVKDQASGVNNGIYIADTSEWQRAPDCDGSLDIVTGTLIRVNSGTNAGYWSVTTTGTIIVGTTSIAFAQVITALAGVSAFAETLLDDTTAAAARTTLELVAGGAGDIWVEKAGDTMTGALVLSGDPAAALQPATLRSVTGYLHGLGLSNNSGDATNDIDIAAGGAVDSTATKLMRLASGLTKQLDANWAAGTNQGMRNSGAAITNTTYHIYLVATAAGAEDIYAHTSTTVATVIAALQAESGGSSYLYARRIGSIIRSGATILAFVQDGDQFALKTLVRNTVSNPGTTATTAALSGIPAGIRVNAILYPGISDATGSREIVGLVSDLSVNDEAPNNGLANYGVQFVNATGVSAGAVNVMTDTSSQVRNRISVSDANISTELSVRGWIDRRGRDA